MNCPKCGLENPEGARFCMRCGKELLTEADAARESGLFCYKHPKVGTSLSCGRCGRPVCTKCVVLGPAGPRCRDCARQKIPVRPGAVVHEAKVGVSRLFRAGPWSIYLLILAVGALGTLVRGCVSLVQERQRPPVESYEPPPAEGK